MHFSYNAQALNTNPKRAAEQIAASVRSGMEQDGLVVRFADFVFNLLIVIEAAVWGYPRPSFK